MEGWKLYTICTLQLPNITASTSHGLIISNRYCSCHCLNVYHNKYYCLPEPENRKFLVV